MSLQVQKSILINVVAWFNHIKWSQSIAHKCCSQCRCQKAQLRELILKARIPDLRVMPCVVGKDGCNPVLSCKLIACRNPLTTIYDNATTNMMHGRSSNVLLNPVMWKSPSGAEAIPLTMSLWSWFNWANWRSFLRTSKKVNEPHSSPATMVWSPWSTVALYAGCLSQNVWVLAFVRVSHCLTLLSWIQEILLSSIVSGSFRQRSYPKHSHCLISWIINIVLGILYFDFLRFWDLRQDPAFLGK